MPTWLVNIMIAAIKELLSDLLTHHGVPMPPTADKLK